MKTMGRLKIYFLRHKGAIALVMALALTRVLIDLAKPWPAKLVVDYALTGKPLPGFLGTMASDLPGAETPRGLIVWCVAAAIAAVVLSSLLSLFVLRQTVAVAQRLVFDLSSDLFAKLQKLSLSFHGRRSVGDLIQRLGADSFIVYLAISQVLIPIFVAILTLTGMFLIMVRLDPTLTLVAMSVVPLLAAALAVFAKPMMNAAALQNDRQGAIMALAEQSLSAVRVVQGFGREPYMRKKVESGMEQLGEAYVQSAFTSGLYNELTLIVTGVASGIVLLLGGLSVQTGRLTVGDLFLFLGYVAILYTPVTGLATAIGYAVALIGRSRRVVEILDCTEEIPERPNALDLGRGRGEVAFEGVTFAYPSIEGDDMPPRPILRELSFQAHPGQVTAIVGATGAGKTTLMSLLPRFFDPEAGRILVDGHDIRDLSLKSLRENITLVLQEPLLFRMTVAENIAFGRPDASHDEIVESARAAHAHEFISRLPQGYETMIMDKGCSLSGGERQRIAIARALVKDAPILILDEPSSALDARTESMIFASLTELMRDRTTFIISHRLSTIRNADQILALKDGRLVEQGTHESLLKNDNIYADLYRHQHSLTL